MAQTKPTRGRPKDPNARDRAVMIRMTEDERANLEALVVARNEELRSEGLRVKAPDVIRWLVQREVTARGLDGTQKSKAKR